MHLNSLLLFYNSSSNQSESTFVMSSFDYNYCQRRMELSAVSNLQMISEQTHYLKDWEAAGEDGLTRQKNTRSCSFIFHHRHSQNSKYARRPTDLITKNAQGCKRTAKSVVRMEEHSFLERTKTKKLVSDNNSLPALPKKTNGNKLLSFIFKRHPEEKEVLPQSYNTVNLYDILRQDENPEPQPAPSPEKYIEPAICRKKTNPKLRFDYELIKRKKFAMNIRYLRERNNQYDLQMDSQPKQERQKSRLREGYSHNGRNIFINCNLFPKFGSSKYSLEIV